MKRHIKILAIAANLAFSLTAAFVASSMDSLLFIIITLAWVVIAASLCVKYEKIICE